MQLCLVFAYIQYYSLFTFNFTLGIFSCVEIISLFIGICCWYSLAVFCPALLSANDLCCDRRWGCPGTCPKRFDTARIPLLTTLFIHKTETTPRAVRVARQNTGSLKRARMPLKIATRLTGSDDLEASQADVLFRGCDEFDSDLGV
jgi:hypothetical protein